jgi:tetratricopeptide (TPR) repeat protein
LKRIRKVKCDETKPFCLRCTSTGRKCDGYKLILRSTQLQIWRPGQHNQDVAFADLERALSTLIANAEEKRAIYYFREKAAPALAGSLDSSFWNRLVLQVGDSEPAVRLAIMAVGSLFEHMQHEASGSPANDGQALFTGRRYQFAIQCYNKAISALMKRLEQCDSCEDIALLTCILFICVEFLQGNEVEALALCAKGSKVLQSVPNRECRLGTAEIAQRKSNISMVMEDVNPIFTRLAILSNLFGQPIETTRPVLVSTEPLPPELSFSLHGLMEARDALYNLIDMCQEVLKAALLRKWAPDDASIEHDTLFMHQQRMLLNLDNWCEAFATLDCSRDHAAVHSDVHACTLLRMYYLSTYIWIYTCLDEFETAYDSHMDKFTSIITLSESLLVKGAIGDALPHFTFEMGLIPPLYFTAINCRHPLLRRKAVALLRQGPRREGLWDAEPVARVAERVIELEENNLKAGTEGWPEEKDRVHDVAISQRVVTSQHRGYPVQFRLRLWGLDMDFSYIEEFISI